MSWMVTTLTLTDTEGLYDIDLLSLLVFIGA